MTDRTLSRRAFLARSGAVAGGAVLVSSGLVEASRVFAGAGGSTWFEPEVRSSSSGALSTRLLVAEAEVPIARKATRALVYESTYPGPTFEVHAGDLLEVGLVNHSKQPTNLHTHGLHVSPKPPSDDVLLDIAPGKRYRYRYRLPADHPGGTFWYHAHLHMYTDNQVSGGMFGMLVVRGAIDEVPGVAGLEERAVIISQMQVVHGKVAQAATSPLSDQVTLVNGRYQPALEMRTGQTQRWRLINTSVVFLRLQLDGHELNVIAIDGNALQAPQAKTVLEIPPGGRADVLVRAPEAGKFRLRSLSWKPLGVFYNSMVPNPQVLTTLVVKGPAHANPDPLPSRLLPVDDLRRGSVDRRRVFRIEEREPRGVGPNGAYQYFINGRLFDPTRVNTQVPLGAFEEWEFRNLTYEPHPFHIHVNPFQIVAVNGDRNRGESYYRDSGLVPPFGSLTIRSRFLDYTGVFVMHCHVLFHEDHGMMELIEVYGKGGPGPRRIPTTSTMDMSRAELCDPTSTPGSKV
jgi:FtsP/CotA-like multicopper oxidase with cupredoxin domain